MNRRTRLYAGVALLALLLAGCGPCDRLDPVRPATHSGISTYVALGTSIGAGYESGGLVETHQAHAFPALFARQAGVDTFTYDRITPDGIPPLLRLTSLNPLNITNAGRTQGSPRDLAYPYAYSNLSVPGAILFDCGSTARYSTGVFPLIARSTTTSLLMQAAAQEPDLVSFEYGSNEVLGPATEGSGTPIVPPVQFAALLTGTLDALHGAAPNAKLALFTVPDVTAIPYVTTVKPYVTLSGNKIYLLGPDGALTDADFVLLAAAAYIPGGLGISTPLPDSLVLSASEATALRAATDEYNAAIRAEAAARGAALVDLHGVFADIAAHGYDYAGTHYTASLVTGGLFSLDGCHPSDLGHGIIANAMIQSVNAKYGTSIPLVNLHDAATTSASRARPASAGETTALPRIEGLDQALAPLRVR
jgi:hypothetical protein